MDKTISMTQLAKLFQNTHSSDLKNYNNFTQKNIVNAQKPQNGGQGYQFDYEMLNQNYLANQKAAAPMKPIAGTFVGENEKALDPWQPSVPINPADTEKIVSDLMEMGMHFGGSRQMLGDMDYGTERDWDFNFQLNTKKSVSLFQTTKYVWPNEEVGAYVEEHFYHAKESYESKDVTGYYKHRVYPHITLIGRRDLAKYKKVWDSITPEFHHKWLWKSAPHRPQDGASVSKHKEAISKWFDSMLKMTLAEKEDCM